MYRKKQHKFLAVLLTLLLLAGQFLLPPAPVSAVLKNGPTTDVVLHGRKYLEWRCLRDGEFRFTLYHSDITGAQFSDIETVSNLGNDFEFSPLTFTEPGSFYFLIKEVDDGLGGVSYDKSEFVARVIITENEGYLAEDVSYWIFDPETERWGEAYFAYFTNYYEAEDAVAELGGRKILSGRPLVDNEFRFALYHSDLDGFQGGEIARVWNEGESFTFPAMTFSTPDFYYYLIKEVDDAIFGITYDYDAYLAIVTVTDDNLGKQAAHVSYYARDAEEVWREVKEIVFENFYEGEEGTGIICGTKALEGRPLVDGEFIFDLFHSDADGRVDSDAIPLMTTSNVGSSWSFSLNFTLEDIGSHYYVVRERTGSLPGVIYDDCSSFLYQIEVEEADDDLEGRIQVEVIAPKDTEFNNRYDPLGGTGIISGTKALTGRPLEDGEFIFAIFHSDEEGTVSPWALPITTTSNIGSAWAFPLSFTAKDIGIHYYVVREWAGLLPGVSYDSSSFLYRVEVEDDLEGRIQVEVMRPEDTEFNNAYVPESSIGIISGTKALTGRSLREGEFTFELYRSDAEGRLAPGAIPMMTTTNMGNIWSFSLLYGREDTGSHYYIVREKAGSLPGVSYDRSSFLFKVYVQENLEGQILVEVSSPEDREFKNRYTSYTSSPSGSGTISGTKVLEGRPLANGEFSFELYRSDSEGRVAPGASPIMTTTNTGNAWSFNLSYGLGDTGVHYYVVREKLGSLGGVSYDRSSFLFRVDVEYDLAGRIEVNVGRPEDTEFNNRYTSSGSGTISGTKVLEGRPLADGEFFFELYRSDSEGRVALGATPLATTGNVGSVWSFNLTYGRGDEGDHYYVVREKVGSLGGVTYDDASFLYQVRVTDSGSGAILVSVTHPTLTEFRNLYQAVGSYQPVAMKFMVGGPLLADAFEFELVDPEGHVVQKVKNRLDGSIPFEALTFGLEDVGRTFAYTVREVQGTDEEIVYDVRVLPLTLTVSDDGEGRLVVSRAAGDAPLAFTNLFEQVAGDKDEVPVTGEGQSLYTALGLLMMGLALMAAILILARHWKKRINN